MPTKHTSFIPMTPEELPQQRLNKVVTIPPKPDNLDIHLDFWYQSEGLLKDRPKGTPRKLTFVCSLEWAWSPMHSRIDNYYLNPKPKNWLLWNNWPNDNEGYWQWDIVAFSNKVKADERTIAAHMLLKILKFEAKHSSLDRIHMINNTGCLSVEDVQTIGREVWY